MRKIKYRRTFDNSAKSEWKEIEAPEIYFDEPMGKIEVSWEFIESFHSTYSKSPNVAYSNDLSCFLDGDKTLKELNARGYNIRSRKHAKNELEDTDKYLMKYALTDFYRDVLDGKLEFEKV